MSTHTKTLESRILPLVGGKMMHDIRFVAIKPGELTARIANLRFAESRKRNKQHGMCGDCQEDEINVELVIISLPHQV